MITLPINFSIPSCHSGQETNDLIFRITMLALGAILLVAGTVVLRHVSQASIKYSVGVILFLGGILTAIGACIHFDKTPNEPKQKLLAIFEAICTVFDLDQQPKSHCQLLIEKVGLIKTQPEAYLNIMNTFCHFFKGLKGENIKKLADARESFTELYIDLAKAFLNRGKETDITHAISIASSLGFAKGESIYCLAIQKYMNHGVLTAVAPLFDMPSDFKSKWTNWQIHYDVIIKAIDNNHVFWALRVFQLIPDNNSYRKTLQDKFNQNPNMLYEENSYMGSPNKNPFSQSNFSLEDQPLDFGD